MNAWDGEKWRMEYTESSTDRAIRRESHCHAQYELIAVVEGDISVIIEGKHYRLVGGWILLIPPLTYHSVTANEGGRYRRVTALFGKDTIPEVLRPEFERHGKKAYLAPSGCTEALGEACQRTPTAHYAPLVQSLLIQILYEALQSSETPPEVEGDDFLKKALGYIDEHLQEKILLDDLARHTARSKSSLCHLFEAKMKISPGRYILQKKLAFASKLIGEGTPHTVAARRVGYENYSNFYRLYRKALGKDSSTGE